MSHYYDSKQQSEHQYGTVAYHIRGRDFLFKTDSGVFSKKMLDFGSRLLIETVLEDLGRADGRLLDLGCGYGPVGIVMKRLFPAMDVVLCDINERALKLSRQNASSNQTQYITILKSDGLAQVEGTFDLILTNPPIRAGKTVVHRFFEESAARLNQEGRLYVVIQKKQGAPSAMVKLESLFQETEMIAREAGYWIIRCQKPI